IKAAKAAASLQPIIEAVKSLNDVRSIELAADGNDDQVKQLSADLGAHSHELIKDALGKMSQRTEECWTSASRQKVYQDAYGNTLGQAYGMWGLNSTEANALKEVMATAEKIEPVATELGKVTGGADLSGDATEAKKLRDRAREVL